MKIIFLNHLKSKAFISSEFSLCSYKFKTSELPKIALENNQLFQPDFKFFFWAPTY